MESRSDLAALRRSYAEKLCRTAQVHDHALVRAFETVPRERFLGPGPWQILGSADGRFLYRTTPDADPTHLYRDELFAIDAKRLLNNGLPSALAGWIDALELGAGESVVHLGCGTGYYTAIMAEIVGPGGRVAGIEIDPGLAHLARQNLSYLRQVEVFSGDASALAPGGADAVFVNAGATHPQMKWIESLRVGGRLLVPITTSADPDGIGAGGIFLIAKGRVSFEARFVSGVMIYPCLGARDPELNLQLASKQEWPSVRSLRLDPHKPGESCWLHVRDSCLSRELPREAPRRLA